MKMRGHLWRRWMDVAIPVAVGALILALIVPAILRARTAARMTQSRINLKQIGQALHNYYDVYACLPPGAVVRDDGEAINGWPSRIFPYMYATLRYQFNDDTVPWDHDINRFLYCRPEPTYEIPGVDVTSTSDGYGLTHYMGNPNMFHRNSCVTFLDMTDGLTNSWLVAEVSGNYQPWGYPFNWRPLGRRLNDGADSYGRPSKDGVFMGMADISVKWIANDIDESVFANYADAPPVGEEDQVAVPPRQFEYSIQDWEVKSLDLDEHEAIGWCAMAFVNTDGRPHSVIFLCKMKENPRRTLAATDVRRAAEEFPETKVLQHYSTIDDDMAEALTEFTNLEVVGASSLDVSRRGLDAIKRMRALKELIIEEIRAADLAELREALPDCEIRADSVSDD